MGIRNDNRVRDFLTDDLYSEVLDEKQVRRIPHLTTAHIAGLDASVRSRFKKIEHIWMSGDHFYKLAQKHYGDPKLWWIIAWYNTRPTEAHVKVGDLIRIPIPLEKVLFYFNNPRD